MNQQQVAVISRRKTMAILFEESNLPQWTNPLVKLRVGDVVSSEDGEVGGTVTELFDSHTGEVMAKLKTPDNGKIANVVSLQKI